jgi:BirA family transcriptional regulator, biotin operon repressor / biotin---[acetyl-CoA-carboxylase] ligase
MDKAERTGLDAVQIARALAGGLIGSRVVVLSSTTSSNDVVWEMAQAGAPEGLVVFAEEQTAGRGQRGNSWESAPGKGLWFSILLRPNLVPEESARLTNWIVQRIAETIRNYFFIPAVVKFPNDVYVENGKIAGVLVELRAQPGQPHLAVVGIGVNTNQQASDFSAPLRGNVTSLALAARQPIDRQDFAIILLQDLDRTYRAIFAPNS